MITQVALQEDEEAEIWWLNYDSNLHPLLKVGDEVYIVESGLIGTISQIFTSVPKIKDLPINARIGTVIGEGYK